MNLVLFFSEAIFAFKNYLKRKMKINSINSYEFAKTLLTHIHTKIIKFLRREKPSEWQFVDTYKQSFIGYVFALTMKCAPMKIRFSR